MATKTRTTWLTFLLLFLFLVALAGLAGLLVGDFYYTKERFPHNTFIEDVNVSLLTKREAIKKLVHTPVDEVFLTSFFLTSEVGDFRYKPSSLGIFILPRESVHHAFELTHEKGYLEELSKRLSQSKNLCPALVATDDRILKDTLLDLAEEIRVTSKEAFVDFKTSKNFTLVPEVVGREMNLKESFKQVKAALKNAQKGLPIKIVFIRPRITFTDIEKNPPIKQLAQYKTYYGSHDDPNRISNIKLIASLLDNHILLSGEGFSFLSHVGNFSKEKGFKEALVIVGDELVPEYGGGSCQIATTLFNAVSLADLKITKRQNHSIWFNIYPLGRDAMVYSRYADLRFANNTEHPIMLQAKASNRSLTFTVLGTDTGKQVYFTKPKIEGEIGDKPFQTKVFKIVKKDGRLIKKEELKSSYRQAGNENIRVNREKKPKNN